MNWDKFKTYFDKTWNMKPFIESDECNEIYKFLKQRSGNGAKIAPLSFNVFNAFKLTPFNELKCVIIGDNIFNKFDDSNPIANGLLLGSNKKIQPETSVFFREIERKMYKGLNLEYDLDNPDINYLAEQGVLLLNYCLTTEENINHNDLWKPFINYTLNLIPNDVPIIFLNLDSFGLDIKKFKYIFNTDKISKYEWDSEDVFSKVDTILWETKHIGINWLNINCPF